MLRKENRKKRHTCQEEKGTQKYWSTHEGKFKLLAELPPPGKNRNYMCPLGLAVHHPAYETLKRYATEGFPVKTGRNCTKEEIHAAVMRGTHESALSEEELLISLTKQKKKKHRTRHVWYPVKNLKVISQKNEGITNCVNPPQVESIQINTGLFIKIKINPTWVCSFSE